MLELAIILVCFWIYGRLLRPVLANRGKVNSEALGFPDLLVVTVLCSWFGALALRGFVAGPRPQPMTNADVIQSAVLFGTLVGGIAVFLKTRQIALGQLFGFGRIGVWRAIGMALVLLLAAYPLVGLCSALTQWALGDKAQPQDIVKYFQEAAGRSDRWRLLVTAFVGIVVAPFSEEFLFRGYIYGVFRRYLGVPLGLILNAALFAAIHVNVPALPALFVLAGCLTLAYEATGSLLVPMLMHALFNAVMLAAILYSA